MIFSGSTTGAKFRTDGAVAGAINDDLQPVDMASRKLKLMHITQALGGVETAIRHIAACIDPSRFESVLVAPEIVDMPTRTGERVRVLKAPMVRSISPVCDMRSLRSLVRLIRLERPDVLHCHSSKGGFLGRLAGRLTAVPTAYTPHAWAFLSSPRPSVNATFLALEKIARPWTTLFIGSSESEADMARGRVGLRPERVVLWKNSVPETLLPKLPLPRSLEYEYICTIGRPSYQKNLDMLLRGYRRIRQHMPHVKCVALGVGLHSPLKAKIARMADDMDLSEDFIMLPWQNHRETAAIVSHAKAFVLTSRFEGLPFSVLEAMALGKAIVATDVPGTRDVIRGGTNGCLVGLDADEAFARRVLEILGDASLRTRLEQAARDEYLRCYRTEDRISALEAMYAKLAAARIASKEHHRAEGAL